MSNPAEIASDQVAAVVEGALASAEVAVDAANERAEAAEEAARLVSEGAVQREITGRVDDLQEEIEACHRENEALRTEITAVRSEMANLSQTLPTLVTMEILAMELAKISSQPALPSIPNKSLQGSPSSTNPEGVEGGQEDQPADQPKAKRYHLT